MLSAILLKHSLVKIDCRSLKTLLIDLIPLPNSLPSISLECSNCLNSEQAPILVKAYLIWWFICCLAISLCWIWAAENVFFLILFSSFKLYMVLLFYIIFCFICLTLLWIWEFYLSASSLSGSDPNIYSDCFNVVQDRDKSTL